MRTTLITGLVAFAAVACATAPAARPVTATPPAGAVRHVVVFRFKPDASPAKIRQLTEAFAALKDQIPGVLAFEHGVNNSPENLNQGFTHVYLLTFTNAAARDVYLVHPAHKAFGALLGGLGVFDAAFVVDYAPGP
ncbi:MAG: Dabb family protein [Gemmatimonadaceae bacterium]